MPIFFVDVSSSNLWGDISIKMNRYSFLKRQLTLNWWSMWNPSKSTLFQLGEVLWRFFEIAFYTCHPENWLKIPIVSRNMFFSFVLVCVCSWHSIYLAYLYLGFFHWTKKSHDSVGGFEVLGRITCISQFQISGGTRPKMDGENHGFKPYFFN